jgi:hypothetical protein
VQERTSPWSRRRKSRDSGHHLRMPPEDQDIEALLVLDVINNFEQ